MLEVPPNMLIFIRMNATRITVDGKADSGKSVA
jgi:hypothetical protein